MQNIRFESQITPFDRVTARDDEGSLGYWATPSGSEVDFVWWRGHETVAIEVKHARR